LAPVDHVGKSDIFKDRGLRVSCIEGVLRVKLELAIIVTSYVETILSGFRSFEITCEDVAEFGSFVAISFKTSVKA